MARIVHISRWPVIGLVLILVALVGYRVLRVEEEAHAAVVFPVALLTPTPTDVVSALYRAGLDPRSLAAAGVDSEAAGVLAANIYDHLLATPTALPAADNAYAEARGTHDSLERLVRSGIATEQDLTDFATAQSSLASAAAAREAAVEAIFDAATADLADEGVITLLTTIRGHRQTSWRSIPVEFLTVEREEAEWLALRNALAEERIVNAGGEGAGPQGALSSTSSSLLTAARANGTVEAAIDDLAENLGAIESAVVSGSQGP